MNKAFDDLIYQSGLIADGCWDELGTYEQEAIERLIELIVRECSKIIVNGGYRNPALGGKYPLTPPEIAKMIQEHFGVEEQATETVELHSCPYAEELYGNYDKMCDCDEERTRQCAMDI